VGRDPFEVIDIDVELVRRLLRDQHPDLAELALEPAGRGWDNATFRLGDELAVRLPIRGLCAHLVEHEQRWLPVMTPGLPLPVPVPVRTGRPGLGYDWPWSIVPWLAGQPWLAGAPDDLVAAADALARFVVALRRPAPPDAPPNPYRGVPLAERSSTTLQQLADLEPGGEVPDRATLERCWLDHVDLPAWSGAPQWLHGDLHPLNLLVDDGALSAVIDFGDLTAGDPANDLMAGWLLFDGEARDRFLAVAGGGDADLRRRGRGWALAWSIATAANRSATNTLGDVARQAIGRVVDDWHADS